MSTAQAQRYVTPLRYADRTGKAAYIAAKYAPLLTTSVLDVGCDRKQLRAELGDSVRYTGIDMNDAADLVLNLEGGSIPLADRSHATVIAADVLEHVDAMHAVFDELCRVAEGHVIASLPNPYRNFILELARQGCEKFKYYGLSDERPADRHKWFFGADDAKRFFEGRAARNGFVIEQLDVEEFGWPASVREALGDVQPTFQLAAGTIWCVAKRR
jgi:SAM-dependent methyltransferase